MGFTDYIIKNRAVVSGLEAGDWKEAVLKGGRVLTDRGVCTEGYLQTIIRKCEENGPYIVIAPGIAMPHARPEEGALKLGYGIVTLRNPVSFHDPDNDPVSLLIFMAAPSVKEHNEEAVSQIADLCDEEDTVNALIQAGSDDEILNILKEQEF